MTAPIVPDPEAERIRKAHLWEALVNAGLPKDVATQFTSVSQPAAPPGPLDKVKRLAGVVGTGIIQNAGGAVDALMNAAQMEDPLMGGLHTSMAMRGLLPAGPGATAANAAQQATGLPTPETSGEKLLANTVGGGVVGAIGGLPGAMAGAVGGGTQQLAQNAFPNMPPEIAALLGVAGGTAAGAGLAAAQRMRPAAVAGRMLKATVAREGTPYDTRFAPDKAEAMRLLDQRQAWEEGGRQAFAQGGEPAGSPFKQPPTGREALGNTGQALALRAAAEGGPAKTALLKQAQQALIDAPARFTKELANRLGAIGDANAGEALDRSYAKVVDPLYEAARRQSVQVTPEMAQLLTSSPKIARAYTAAAEDYNIGKPPAQQAPTSLFDETGNIRSQLPLGVLDEIKKGFDVIAEGNTGKGATAQNLNEQLRPMLDAQSPTYRIARQVAQEQILQRQALDLGRNVLKEKPDVTLQTFQQLPPSLQPQLKLTVRAGVAYAIKRAYETGKFGDLGKLENAAPFFTPEEIGQLRAIQDEAVTFAQQAKQLKQMAGKVAPTPRPGGRFTKLVFDFLAGMRRALGRDVMLASQESGPAMKPDVQAQLLQLLGPDYAKAIPQILQATQQPAQTTAQGLVGAAIGTAAQPQ